MRCFYSITDCIHQHESRKGGGGDLTVLAEINPKKKKKIAKKKKKRKNAKKKKKQLLTSNSIIQNSQEAQQMSTGLGVLPIHKQSSTIQVLVSLLAGSEQVLLLQGSLGNVVLQH